MPRKDIKIDIQVNHVDRLVDNCLRTIHHQFNCRIKNGQYRFDFIDIINRSSEIDYIKEIISKSKHIPENIRLSIINSYFRIFIIVERSIEEMLSISKRVNLEERMFEVLKTLEYIDLQTERSDNVYLGVIG